MDHEEVCKHLEYDPDTGLFRWKIRRSNSCSKGWFAGSTMRGGYFQINYNKKYCKAHRLAWFIMTGQWPDGEIDHIDRNPSNNKFSNLRVVSHTANMLNNNAKGVKKHGSKWQVVCTVNKKSVYIGLYNTKEEAYNVYLEHKSKRLSELLKE